MKTWNFGCPCENFDSALQGMMKHQNRKGGGLEPHSKLYSNWLTICSGKMKNKYTYRRRLYVSMYACMYVCMVAFVFVCLFVCNVLCCPVLYCIALHQTVLYTVLYVCRFGMWRCACTWVAIALWLPSLGSLDLLCGPCGRNTCGLAFRVAQGWF